MDDTLTTPGPATLAPTAAIDSDHPAVQAWAAQHGHGDKSYAELVASPEVRALIELRYFQGEHVELIDGALVATAAPSDGRLLASARVASLLAHQLGKAGVRHRPQRGFGVERVARLLAAGGGQKRLQECIGNFWHHNHPLGGVARLASIAKTRMGGFFGGQPGFFELVFPVFDFVVELALLQAEPGQLLAHAVQVALQAAGGVAAVALLFFQPRQLRAGFGLFGLALVHGVGGGKMRLAGGF